MAITLPIELVVAPGSTDAAIRKATADAGKALEAAAKEEAKRLDYIDGLKRRYFAEEQRRIEAAVRAEERAQAQMLAAEQRRLAQAEALNARVAASEAAAASRFEAALVGVQGAVAGLSTEEVRLQALTKQAAELYNRGAISADKYAAAVNAIGDRQKQLRAGLSQTDAELGTVADSAGHAGSAAGRLAGAFSMLSPGAGEAARSVGDLADVAEVAAEVLGRAAKTGAAGLLTTLGPLALAIGAATLAFSAYQSAAEEAERATQEAKEAAERATSAYAQMTSQLYDATIQQRLLSGELTEGEAASLRAGRSVAETFGPALAEAAQNLAAANQAVADYRTELGKGEGSTSSVRARMAELEATAAEAENTFGLLRDRYLELTSTATANATATEALKTAKEGAAEASKAHKDALKEESEELDAQEDLIGGVTSALEGWSASMGLFGTDTVLATQEVDAAIEDETASLGGMTDQALDLMLGLDDAAGSAFDLVEEVRSLDGAIVDSVSAMQGGLEGIIGLVGGPVAGAVAGLVLNLEDTIGTIREQLASLPQILTSAPGLVADLVVDLVEEVVPALMEAVPRIAEALALAVTSPEFITAIVKLNAMIFNPATGLKIGLQIARGLWDAFLVGWESFASGEMFAGFIDAFKAGWDNLFSGHFVSDLVEGFIAAAKAFVGEVKDSLTGLFTKDEGGTTGAGDLAWEVLTLGQAETRYGDTPTPIRWGDRGPPFSPDDWVAAARTREGLERQTNGGGAAPPAMIDLANGHTAFDGQLRRATRQPRTRRELFGFTPARKLA